MRLVGDIKAYLCPQGFDISVELPLFTRKRKSSRFDSYHADIITSYERLHLEVDTAEDKTCIF